MTQRADVGDQRDCRLGLRSATSAIAGCRNRRVRIAPETQAIFFRRRHQPRRPPLQLVIVIPKAKAC